jgi:hypothetical protein
MATSEEKTELVEAIKGPRFYRISLWGYGGEAAYMNLTKEAFDFWHKDTEENGEGDLVQYLINEEEADAEYDNIETVPAEADFLRNVDDPKDTWKSPWFEAPNEFCHQNGVEYSNARINVEEVSSMDYSADHVAEVELDTDTLSDIVDALQEEDADRFDEMVEWGEGYEYDDQGEYVCQLYSAEKGTFFEAIIETTGDFDVKKLRVINNEYPNGEDIVDGLIYDGVDVDNEGGDTNGKGYSASVWRIE